MGYKKIVQSGNLLEIYEYQKNLPERFKRKIEKVDGKRIKRSFSRREDNARRLRRQFIRIIRSNLTGAECPLLVTLTCFEVLRVDVAFRAFTGFVARCRRCFGREFRYISAVEFQQRGAPHFHCLFWGLPEKEIENEIKTDSRRPTTRRIQNLWSYGTADCRRTDNSPKLAGYLAKYMYKSLLDSRLLGKKAYATSRNIMRPMSFSNSTAFDYADMIWGVDKLVAYEKEFDTMFLGRCHYKSYNLE